MKTDTERLKKMCEEILRMAKNQLVKTGGIRPMLMFENKFEGGAQAAALVEMPSSMAALLNSGEGKDALFDGLRHLVRKLECTGCAILTDSWFRKTTPAGELMGVEAWKALYDKIGPDEMEKRGLITNSEALVLNIQTPNSVLLVTQPYTRDASGKSITFGVLDEAEFPIDQFEGRQKMFGDLSEDKLHLHRNSKIGKTRGRAKNKDVQ